MHFTAADRLAVPVPFYHCFGMVLANLLCLSVGACIVIPCEHFDAADVLSAVQAERCTAIHGVPTMFIAELEHPQLKDFDLSTLRTGIMAGASCPPALMQRVMRELHCSEMLIGYGETEASPLTHLTSRNDTLEHRVETVGTNLPHQEVKIVAVDSRKTVPLGSVGEICFRGYHVMRGYYGDSDSGNSGFQACLVAAEMVRRLFRDRGYWLTTVTVSGAGATSTRLRPLSFAAYRASSAREIASLTSSPLANCVTPIEIVTR